MAQETLGIINLEWVCPNCGVKNPGPQKTCKGCGSPQPENVEFQQPETAEFITDENEIKKSEAGADIHCGFCGARNAATNTICTQCGADLKEGKQRQSGQVIGAFQNKPVQQIACPNCSSPNPATADRCSKCGAPLQRSLPQKAQPAEASVSKKAIPVFLILIPLILILVCGVIALLMLFRTETTVGTVQSVAWTRSIIIEKFADVTRETWKDEIPSGAKLGACEKKYHHTQSDPVEGAEKVCGTPYTIDTGTGQGKVVQDCQYRVSKDYCKYTVQEWQKADEVIARGTDFKPVWPEPKIASGQRLGKKDEAYTINFTSEKADYKYLTKNPDEFLDFQIGGKWELTVNALNQVTSVKPNK
jgi:ribosomal protein L40E